MNVYHITYTPDTETACIYFLGCNFSCKGCIRKKGTSDIHLKKGWIKKDVIKRHKLDEVVEILSRQPVKKAIFLGGEPTIDTEFNQLAKILHYDYSTYNILITNGHLLPPLDGINEICLSIKAVTPTLHYEFTGMSNKNTLLNFKYLNQINNIVLRSESIFIPGYIGLEEIEKIAKFIASCNSNIHYRIDGYSPVPNTQWRAPTEDELIDAMTLAKKYLQNVTYLWQGTKLKAKVIEII